MKVLLYHCMPFSLAHGGQQIQITRTLEGLRQTGLDAEFLDWHRPEQRGDVLHFFGRIPPPLLHLARAKGMKVVVADLLAAQAARSPARLAAEKLFRRLLERMAPSGPPAWTTYREADACVSLTTHEQKLLQQTFLVDPAKTFVVPNGVDDVFLEPHATERGMELICVATITPMKRVLELARAAVASSVPLQFIGRPYSEADEYYRSFAAYAAEHSGMVRYRGAIEARGSLAREYRQARGFVLVSDFESQSLAALEAAACGCRLLLTDLPWARSTFGGNAVLCPLNPSHGKLASVLRNFYDAAPQVQKPPRPATWKEVAIQLKGVYQKC